MSILVLIAGANDPSNSAALADAFVRGVQQFGEVNIDKVRLKNLSIEHFSLRYYDVQTDQGEEFRKIQSLMEAANGFVIATPVWNFGVPAHLKNLIDRMGSFALNETHSKGMLNGKPFYIIFTGGAPLPAWKGLMKKTTSFVPEGLKYFGASYIGHHFEGKCTVGRGKFGLVVDKRPKSLEAVRRKGFDFAKVVSEYERTGKAPAEKRMMAKMMKLGEALLKKVG